MNINTWIKGKVRKLIVSTLAEIRNEEERVMIHVMPGGKKPERKSDGAIGYDTFARAIVSASEMDSKNPVFRKTIFDFVNMPSDPEVASRIINLENGTLAYRMRKGESVTVGIGFVTAMVFPKFYWVTPRSGLSSRYGITVTNAPGTVDPDYRGEAGVLLYNREQEYFDLAFGMRIAQILFQTAIIPTFDDCDTLSELPKTRRGSGGFGSTGLY